VSNYRYFITEESTQAIIVHITESRMSSEVISEIFRLELARLVADTAPRNLIVDFHSVTMISSSFISALIVLRNQLDRDRVSLLLCDMPVSIREVYRTLNLEGTVFDIFDSVPSALRSVVSRPGPGPTNHSPIVGS
jgi:anti-anti-sigma regulatory factor